MATRVLPPTTASAMSTGACKIILAALAVIGALVIPLVLSDIVGASRLSSSLQLETHTKHLAIKKQAARILERTPLFGW